MHSTKASFLVPFYKIDAEIIPPIWEINILNSTYFHKRSRLRAHVINGVQGHPHHGGETHAQAHGLAPPGVLEVLAVGHGGVGDDVEDENGQHDSGSEILPA